MQNLDESEFRPCFFELPQNSTFNDNDKNNDDLMTIDFKIWTPDDMMLDVRYRVKEYRMVFRAG